MNVEKASMLDKKIERVLYDAVEGNFNKKEDLFKQIKQAILEEIQKKWYYSRDLKVVDLAHIQEILGD